MAVSRLLSIERIVERHQALLTASAALLYEIHLSDKDPLGGTLEVLNERIEEITGYPADEFTRSPDLWFRLLHPDDVDTVRQTTLRLAEDKSSGIRQYRLRHKETGAYRWLEDHVTVLLDNDGQVRGLLGIVYDITERRRWEQALAASEEALRVSNEHFRTALKDSPIVVFDQDRELRYTWIANLAGSFREENVLGKSDAELFPADYAARLEAVKRAVLESGIGRREDVQMVLDGEEHSYDLIVEPLHDAHGNVVGITCASWDISDRRRMKKALDRQAAQLARSNVELEQFAYAVSHDLQEPLRAVVSYLQLLQRRYQGQLGPEADKFIGHSVDAAIRMRMLINDLLAYSRVNRHGKSFAPVDCETVLRDALSNLSTAISDTDATVTHDPLPTLVADPTQLAQLLQNLIGNAIKFRSAASPHIQVSARRQGTEWLFSVSDNGIGIEPQYAERIFELFQRLHTQREYEGTGVGLAVSKRIVERHGGRIWVEPAPGGGSTFYFTLKEEGGEEPS